MADQFSATEEDEKEKEMLYKKVQELRASNATLLAENDMLEHFISHLDPQDLVSQSAGPAGGFQLDGAGRGWRRRSRSSVTDRIQQLSLEQKLDVVASEITALRADNAEKELKHKRIQDDYKAVLTEAELRRAEIKKAKNVFEYKLVKLMKEKKRMKEPERVINYLQDKLQVTQLEQLNLKNVALKARKKKLQQQLQHKTQVERVEDNMDNETFEDYSAQTFNKNLCEVKANTKKVHRILNSHKEKLQRVTQESKEVTDSIRKRREMLAKIEEEIENAEKERVKAEALNQHLSRQMTDYSAPDILEYMRVKKKHKELQCSVRTLERKVAIAEMTLKSHSQAWNKERAANCAEGPAGSP